LLDPHGNSDAEGAKAPRRGGEIGLEQPLEFDERLFKEAHVVDAVEVATARLEAIADGIRREGGVVFLAREALLLGCSEDAPVLDQRRGAVVIEGRYAKNASASHPPVRAKKWCR